jgi:hypothetical protein
LALCAAVEARGDTDLEVLDRALDRGHREEGGAAVEVDSSASLVARGRGGRDVDGVLERIEELPEDRGGAVAEDQVLAAGDDGGHEAAVEAQTSVSHGVDASVNAVEVATFGAVAHSASAQAGAF